MAEATLYTWRVDPRAEVTARFQEASYFPAERTCCPLCATFMAAVERPVLPGALLTFLRAVGADPLRPQEVWGATDGGFMNGWWVIGGTLVSGPDGADLDHGAVEPLPGLHIWVTPRLAMRRPEGLEGAALLQVEFLWNDDAVKELDRTVWPPPGEPDAGATAARGSA